MSGVGVLPAAPLIPVVEAMVARAGSIELAQRRLGISDNDLRHWKQQPRMKVSFAKADRVITGSWVLWFDVWAPCPDHQACGELACRTCETYFKARQVFTGEPWPKPWKRNGRRP